MSEGMQEFDKESKLRRLAVPEKIQQKYLNMLQAGEEIIVN